ncbi:MAG TPA: mechanosensitive ion channel domain-containing protein [Pantanalinema sp.]
MRHRLNAATLSGLALAAALSFALPARAEAPQEAVLVGGKAVFSIGDGYGQSGRERAMHATEKLAGWLSDPNSIAALRVESLRKGPAVVLGDEALLSVSESDAISAGTSREELAGIWEQRLEAAAEAERVAKQTQNGPLGTGLAIAKNLLAALAVLVGGTIAAWLITWGASRLAEMPWRPSWRVNPNLISVIGGIGSIAVAVGSVAVAITYLPGAYSLPVTVAMVAVGAMALIASAESLGNVAGGLVVKWNTLYAEGDHVRVGGFAGRVKAVGHLFTRLETEHHGERLIPNSSILRRGVSLLSAPTLAEIKVPVRLAYTVSRDLAQAIIVEAALRTHGLTDEPMPECLLAELEDEVIRYELHGRVQAAETPEVVISRFHVNLLDVLGENALAPGGQPMTRPKARLGVTTLEQTRQHSA